LFHKQNLKNYLTYIKGNFWFLSLVIIKQDQNLTFYESLKIIINAKDWLLECYRKVADKVKSNKCSWFYKIKFKN
jgi:hypothetical protein